VGLLLGAGAELDARNKIQRTPLYFAAAFGHVVIVEALLRRGANANAVSTYGYTPLAGAVLGKQPTTVAALLPVTDLSIRSREGRSALQVAVISGSQACFDAILPHVSDVDERSGANGLSRADATAQTALHLSCGKGQLEMAKALLRRDASRLALDSDSRTPLHHAAVFGHLAVINLLLGGNERRGRPPLAPSEVDLPDKDGFTALQLTAKHGFERCCGALLAAGADVQLAGGRALALARAHHPRNGALLSTLSSAQHRPAGGALPGTACDVCGAQRAPETKLRTCARCLSAQYCGEACQLTAWPQHRSECSRLNAERMERLRIRIIPSVAVGPGDSSRGYPSGGGVEEVQVSQRAAESNPLWLD